jgi:hypothetical protein
VKWAARDDAPTRIASVTRSLFGEGRVAAVVASEITLLYYAFCKWGKPQPPVAEAQPVLRFTVHERGGWNTVLACIVVLIAAESLGMHLLLARWSVFAAWTWTGLDLWALCWLFGDYNALRHHPSTFDGETLRIRHGLRWRLDIPVGVIEGIERVHAEAQWKQRDILKVAMIEDPQWVIRLREPLVAEGLAGFRKSVRGVALLPDDDAVIDALTSTHRAAG